MADNLSLRDKLVGLQGNLFNFACRLTANRDTAQDLVQDTTLKVLDNQSKYVDNVNFKGWVFTIMRNIFINNYRRQTRSATIVDTTEDLYHLNVSQESGLTTPEGSYAVKEISKAIGAFNQEYRVPFHVHRRLQVWRDSRKDGSAFGHGQEPHLLRPQASAEHAERIQVIFACEN